MSNKLEFKGKDIDEAIGKACKKFNAPQEELDIEVVFTGSTGIFGLCKKQAIIRAIRKPKETQRKAPSEEHKTKATAVPVDNPAEATVVPETRQDEPEDAELREEASPEPMKERKNPSTPPQVAPLTPEILSSIQEELNRLLTMMGFPSELQVEERKQKAHVTISGSHVEELTSNDGQVLDNVQYLMRKIIGKKFPQKILFAIDAGDFREKRKQELHELALKLAAEVKETEKNRTIPPLNPAERRIVHMALQDDKAIRSRSIGEGLFKKILIYLPGKGRGRQSGGRRKSRKN